MKHIRQLSSLTLKEIIWSRNCNKYHIRKLSKYCKWRKLCKRIKYSNSTAQLRKINANHACVHEVCENQSEYCYSARIMNERWEYNNLAFVVYMHQTKYSEDSSQSTDICCEKRKRVYLHIKIKHSQQQRHTSDNDSER